MAKSIIEIKCTELDIVEDLVNLCVEFYVDMPEDMRVKFDAWTDKVRERKREI